MKCPVCKQENHQEHWVNLAMGLYACPNCSTVVYPYALKIGVCGAPPKPKPKSFFRKGE